MLNKDLRVQTTQEDNAEADYPWIGGVGLLAVNDTPSTASNAINFYIRLDGNITCIGSKTLTSSRNIRQLSKTNAVSAYTAVVETSLTTGNLQSSYYLRYNTTGSTTSFSSTAGSSRVRMDFSNNSLIMLYPWSIPLFVGKRNIYAAQCNGFLYPFVGADAPDGPFWGISRSGASYFCPRRQK